jgi:uncharacterized caspase-like protein
MKRSLSLWIFLLIGTTCFCQVPQHQVLQNQRRLALVIGNGNYPSNYLANPENDARAMKAILANLDFEIMLFENQTQAQMKKAIDDFGIRLKNYEVGLFYYAGHGIQTKGYNYLIPVDAKLQSEAQVEYDCVQADRVLTQRQPQPIKEHSLLVDAFR